MFPNRGFNTEPIIISRIEDKNGNVLQTFESESKQVISEVDAYTMYKMMQGVVDFGTGGSMRWKYNITSDMGGKTGTTNLNTDGWFMGYTPQILAGAWVGCDDPFLHLSNGWTNGGNDMAMPEWAYFMQKIYADKRLGIDPKATFQKPAELNNDPIYADQNFSNLVKEGEGNDIEKNGNGNAGDYENSSPNVPVESEFNKDLTKDNSPSSSAEKKVIGPVNMADEFKKDTSKTHPKNTDEKIIDKKVNKEAEDKSKKPVAKPAKSGSDY
jgi:penicillin-binding protein 1A